MCILGQRGQKPVSYNLYHKALSPHHCAVLGEVVGSCTLPDGQHVALGQSFSVHNQDNQDAICTCPPPRSKEVQEVLRTGGGQVSVPCRCVCLLSLLLSMEIIMYNLECCGFWVSYMTIPVNTCCMCIVYIMWNHLHTNLLRNLTLMFFSCFVNLLKY